MSFLLATLLTLAAAAPSRPALPPVVQSATTLGNSTSNLPRIYRDGGGGGMIGGQTYVVFSDGIYSKLDHPSDNLADWANFTSNSISLIDPTNPTSLTDYGDQEKGPRQVIPFRYDDGESESATGIWPQQNIVTLCDGECGVSFPVVITRDAGDPSKGIYNVATLYNTAVKYTISDDGPVAERTVTQLFKADEPLYGTFSAVTGIDGYLYLFAAIADNSPALGLKLARVPQTEWADRGAYRFWDGEEWSEEIPGVDDEKSAVMRWETHCMDDKGYGPHNGDIFWSAYYNVWIMIFQPADAACDDNVYMSWSTKLDGGWSTPESVFKMASAGSYSYSLHAYPTLDPTGKTVVLSWTQLPAGPGYYIAWGKLEFA